MTHPNRPTVGRYPSRVLEDEQFLEFGPCRFCGANCEGHTGDPGPCCGECKACQSNRAFDCREGRRR